MGMEDLLGGGEGAESAFSRVGESVGRRGGGAWGTLKGKEAGPARGEAGET